MAPRTTLPWSTLAALTVSAASTVAHACPSCAANGADTTRTVVSIGVFLLLPFVLVGVVVAFVRTLPNDRDARALRATKR